MKMPKYLHRIVPFDCCHIEEECNKCLKEGYVLNGILPSMEPDFSTVLLAFETKTTIYKEDSPYYMATPLKSFKCMEVLRPDSTSLTSSEPIDSILKELHDTHPENEFRIVANYATYIPKKEVIVFSVF